VKIDGKLTIEILDRIDNSVPGGGPYVGHVFNGGKSLPGSPVVHADIGGCIGAIRALVTDAERHEKKDGAA
jgi:hypothetical protein